jgi:hypothetical protein
MPDEEPATVAPFHFLASGDGTGIEFAEAGVHVLRNRDDLERLWAVIEPHRPLPQAMSDLVWPQEMIVLCALGTRPTGGYDIVVDRIVRHRETLAVHLHEIRPTPDAEVTQALTQPYVAVATPVHSETIESEFSS